MTVQTAIRPAIVAVNDDKQPLQLIAHELQKRYGSDYEIHCTSTAASGLKLLEEIGQEGKEVALVLADQWMPEMTGTDFLSRAQPLHPKAKRVLVTDWGDNTAFEAVLQSTTLGQIDYFIMKPHGPRDEQFHRQVTEFLEDWSTLEADGFENIRVIGEQWSSRSHEFRDLLGRNGVPYGFYDMESLRGRELIEEVQAGDGPFPVVIMHNGSVLRDPTNEEVADAIAFDIHPEVREYDVAVVGGGPAGLGAAVYGASEGLQTLVIEREAIGGQAGTSSLIRNYLGFPRGISGKVLAGRASQQAWLFGAKFFYMRGVVSLKRTDGRWLLGLSDGREIITRTVVLAMGASYRRLGAPGIDQLLGKGVFYSAAVTEAKAMTGADVFVVGGGNSAGQAALHLARYAGRVTMVVRGESLTSSMSDYLIRELQGMSNIEVRLHAQVTEGIGIHRLEGLMLEDLRSGNTEWVGGEALFILIGAQPFTEWLPEALERDTHGFVLTGSDLRPGGRAEKGMGPGRRILSLETSLAGIFAAGDVRHGSVKRVASAVGEGATAIKQIHEYLNGTY